MALFGVNVPLNFDIIHTLTLYVQSRREAREAIDSAKELYYTTLIKRLSNPDIMPNEYHRICKCFFRGKNRNPPFLHWLSRISSILILRLKQVY